MGGAKCQEQPAALLCTGCEISMNKKGQRSYLDCLTRLMLICYCISTLGGMQSIAYTVLHSQFCIETVTQIESEVISPGSVFGGLMYISVL